MKKKYCQLCGGEMSATAKFCMQCGAQVAQRPATTGDQYVDDCMQFLEEIEEKRGWPDLSGAEAMLDAGNEGRTQEALRLADKLRKNYSDFYFSYVWLGILYRRPRTPQRRSMA